MWGASASVTWQQLRYFFAWIAHAATVARYIDWRIERAGCVHRGIATYSKLLMRVLHPRTGYLTQQPHFHETLPESAPIDDGASMGETTFQYAKQSLSSFQDDELSTSRA